MKTLYPKGTLVTYHFEWYGRKHAHDGHRCRVVESEVKRGGMTGRRYYKYRLHCLKCDTQFKAEDLPPVQVLTPTRRSA